MTETTTAQSNPNPAHRVCPPDRIGGMDNFFRTLVHNPRKLFGRHVRPGMTALDMGCGGGWAAQGLAELVGPKGRVIASDLQSEMLDMVRARLDSKGLADRVVLHQCQADRIGVTERLDFAVAFWMAHETPDRPAFLAEILSQLKPGGRLFVAEPVGHVSKRDFFRTVDEAQSAGFTVIERPRVFLSRAVVLEKRPG